MNQLKIENHNAVTLLNRLRQATCNALKSNRKQFFNDLRNALKSLGMIEAKSKVEAIYEGVDANGDHWFMVQLVEAIKPDSAEERFKRLRSCLVDLGAIYQREEPKFCEGWFKGILAEFNVTVKEMDDAYAQIKQMQRRASGAHGSEVVSQQPSPSAEEEGSGAPPSSPPTAEGRIAPLEDPDREMDLY